MLGICIVNKYKTKKMNKFLHPPWRHLDLQRPLLVWNYNAPTICNFCTASIHVNQVNMRCNNAQDIILSCQTEKALGITSPLCMANVNGGTIGT
jgi:hypothetical protein